MPTTIPSQQQGLQVPQSFTQPQLSFLERIPLPKLSAQTLYLHVPPTTTGLDYKSHNAAPQQGPIYF